MIYDKDFISPFVAGREGGRLWAHLPWEAREGAPRREAWMNFSGAPYRYGNPDHGRTYRPQPWDDFVLSVMQDINTIHGCDLNCCFLNGYAHQRQHLGWHSDDSPEMDPTQPIAVVSLGAEREIWFRPIIQREPVHHHLLHSGSLLLMPAGFQQTHQHRIPKASAECGWRISFTFRRLV